MFKHAWGSLLPKHAWGSLLPKNPIVRKAKKGRGFTAAGGQTNGFLRFKSDLIRLPTF